LRAPISPEPIICNMSVLICARRTSDGVICGHRYGANGSDFHIRKCPNCQGGAPGLAIERLL
jgi:hypothetical protein